MELCLKTMWKNNLKTHACCAGDMGDYDGAYILMADVIDIFGYLTKEILENDMVLIKDLYGEQLISYCGTMDEKEEFMIMLANSIANGKNNLDDLVQEKLKKVLVKNM